MDKAIQKGSDQWELVRQSKEYFSKKLTKEDIFVIVGIITNSFWVRTDEKLNVMVFRHTDNREFSIGLWNETIFDVVSEIIDKITNEAVRAGKNIKLHEIKECLEL
jgi:hypothetical protein